MIKRDILLHRRCADEVPEVNEAIAVSGQRLAVGAGVQKLLARQHCQLLGRLLCRIPQDGMKEPAKKAADPLGWCDGPEDQFSYTRGTTSFSLT